MKTIKCLKSFSIRDADNMGGQISIVKGSLWKLKELLNDISIISSTNSSERNILNDSIIQEYFEEVKE